MELGKKKGPLLANPIRVVRFCYVTRGAYMPWFAEGMHDPLITGSGKIHLFPYNQYPTAEGPFIRCIMQANAFTLCCLGEYNTVYHI